MPPKKVKADAMEEEEKVTTKKGGKAKKSSVDAVATGELPQLDDFLADLATWKSALEKTTKEKYFVQLYKFIKDEYSSKVVYPPPNLIFNAFKVTPLEKVKVVIIGQDPYHQPGQAMGLCFSVPKGIPTPSSLQNVYKSLCTDPKIKGFKKPSHGDLTKWAKQGVFLLNTILTVVYDTPDSHRKSGWDEFTDEVVNVINRERTGVIFLLWGKPAQKKGKSIDQKKHHVLETSHPSGLSFTKGFDKAYHFSKVNEILKGKGETEIDWSLDD
eukprot:CAMPEP_0176408264 /NCGR_PEP_ID=MMETSP0127-20121128/1857_1 /TAXON_ID=938130 /ORGANISM="Platyophrya macrostoma, Strain WH" /LENGTH=269 /DNA_ID=CAMNT_0017787535 /DNA_START=34 /DNA_END=843 /DNA_ORIENTATION=+